MGPAKRITTFSTDITHTQKARPMNMAEFFDKFLCKDCFVKNSNNCDASTHSSALHHLHTPTHSQRCSVFIKTWQYSVALAPLLFQQQRPLHACRSSVASHVLISRLRAMRRPFASVKIEGKNVCFVRKKKSEARVKARPRRRR